MILLYWIDKEFPFFVADTVKDKCTFPYQTIAMSLSQYNKKVFRYEEYSKMIEKLEESSYNLIVVDITSIDITDAEKAEAAIYSTYPELLL
jgi:hypothetical protein